jgi:hypothetical protein
MVILDSGFVLRAPRNDHMEKNRCVATSARCLISSRRRPKKKSARRLLQFVRKLSGFTHASRANEDAFNRAVDEVSDAARRLLSALSTTSPAKNREVEAMKARERAKARFA